MDVKKTGELLGRLRKEKGMTQKQAAEQLRISDRTISKWERIRKVSTDAITNNSTLVGLSYLYLINFTPHKIVGKRIFTGRKIVLF